ncbi:MAG: sigma-E factor negative regulatory protein [Gammaproteobacteria bacterium]|nr:sigma-E factor negative regulatory protein [Gammaproteobacteria bacterium]
MSQDVNESISVLYDDELDAVERKHAIDKLKHSKEHQAMWNRYSMLSEALKRDLHSTPSHDLFSRIQTAIESEPTLLSPSPAAIHSDKDVDVVTPPKQKVEDTPGHKSNPVFGLAVAASFALMTVVGFQFMSSKNADTQAVPALAKQTTLPAPGLQMVVPADNLATTVAVEEEPVYAEQSVINDGQWTRITHIGNLELGGRVIDRSAEAHVNVSVPSVNSPFTRPVNMDNTPNQ